MRRVLLFVVAMLGLAIFVTTYYYDLRDERQFRTVIEEKQRQLDAKREELERKEERLEFFRSEEGKAWLAREQLNMAGVDEEVYVVDRVSGDQDLLNFDR